MAENDSGLRYWNRRVTRRRVLAGAAGGSAAIVAFGLVGCNSGDDGNGGGGLTEDPDSTAVADGYQDGPGIRGGILRTREAVALPSFNPFGPGIFALAQGLVLGFTVFDHMWYVPTDTGVLEMFLATKVEQPDDTTVIATIGDAVFQDKGPAPGRKVEAEDIAASFKRFREEAPIGYSWLHSVMDDIVAVDEKTVKITQKQPWAWVYTSSNAGSPIFSSILPREVLHDHDDFLQKDAVGSGHWIVNSHDNGANLKLRRFDKFRTFQNGKDITGQPFLDGVDFVSIPDPNVALAAFRSAELDIFGFSGKKDADETKADLGNKIAVGSDLSRDYFCLMITYQEPFLDKRVRQGFNRMLDRDETILLMADGNALKAGPMPPAHKRYVLPEDDATLQDYWKHDIADGKAMLEAAGWDFNREIVLKHSTRQGDSDLARIIKQQLERGGVKVKLEGQDLVKWFSQTLNQGDFEMTCFQHLPYEDPDLPLRFYLGPEGDRTNFMKYKDPKVDEAILAAARELNEEERVKKVYDAQRVIMDEAAPMINIMSKVNYAARYGYVKGAVVGRGSYGAFNRTTFIDKSRPTVDDAGAEASDG